METIDSKLYLLMSEKLGLEPSEIHPGDKFSDDLGVDSLDVTELFTDVEKEFGIKISDEDAEKLTTVQSLVAYVHKHLS
jgi:acyl carrier protein